MFKSTLIRKKPYAQLASIQDLLIISDDLSGSLKRFLLELENDNRSPATITYYKQFINWFLVF